MCAVKIFSVHVCSLWLMFLDHCWVINVTVVCCCALNTSTIEAIKYRNLKAKCYVYLDFVIGKEWWIHERFQWLVCTIVLQAHVPVCERRNCSFEAFHDCECIVKWLNCTRLIFLEIFCSKVDKTLAESPTLVKGKHLEKPTRTEMDSNSEVESKVGEDSKLKEAAEPGIGKHTSYFLCNPLFCFLWKIICSAMIWIYYTFSKLM